MRKKEKTEKMKIRFVYNLCKAKDDANKRY